VILDDLSNDAYPSKCVTCLREAAINRNISVILITQNVFHQGRYCRDISLNAHYLVALRNVRDKNKFAYLAQQVYSEDSLGLFEAYLEATQRSNGYLILDLTQDTNTFCGLEPTYSRKNILLSCTSM